MFRAFAACRAVIQSQHLKTTSAAFLVLTLTAASSAAERPVFPGAQGFGIHTLAGRGGKLIRVANLNADGPGSLREALDAKGPRIVVFEVGGVIDLNRNNLTIREPFLTLAGQTAPSPGITLIRGGIRIATHDLLIQHLRVRPGDAGQPKRSAWEPEVTTSGPDSYHIVIDHCSVSWAVDENLSASGPRYNGPQGASRNVTFSNNILAEGLYDATHSKGIHSMGSLVHDNCTNIAVIGNLYAHNNQRNPYFKAFTTGVIVNNLIYNPGRAAIQVDFPLSEWKDQPVTPQNARVSVVGNVLIHGANTVAGLALVSRKGDVFLEDNIALDRAGNPVSHTSGSINVLKEKPSWPQGLAPLPAGQVIEQVLRHAGARPRDRDQTGLRIIREFRERKGRFIDSQNEVGGYPKPVMTRRKLAAPAQDIDEWLAKLAAGLE